jgi:hypothetical protein
VSVDAAVVEVLVRLVQTAQHLLVGLEETVLLRQLLVLL